MDNKKELKFLIASFLIRPMVPYKYYNKSSYSQTNIPKVTLSFTDLFICSSNLSFLSICSVPNIVLQSGGI